MQTHAHIHVHIHARTQAHSHMLIINSNPSLRRCSSVMAAFVFCLFFFNIIIILFFFLPHMSAFSLLPHILIFNSIFLNLLNKNKHQLYPFCVSLVRIWLPTVPFLSGGLFNCCMQSSYAACEWLWDVQTWTHRNYVSLVYSFRWRGDSEENDRFCFNPKRQEPQHIVKGKKKKIKKKKRKKSKSKKKEE